MNDGLTISTAQLLRMFPDEAAARHYIESRRWPNGPRCPICGLGERIGNHSPGLYRCFQCREAFSVRTGTIFERSHVPLHKWLHAMYLLVTARKGISSLQLSKEIGITQKSAWFILQRLREACGKQLDTLRGIVLDAITDLVLAHRPKPKSKPAKKRARRQRKIQRKSSI
jgi:transposase-like protein